MSLRLSVLDQSPITEGSTGAAALRNSIDLAQLPTGSAITRYWVAEHHGTPMLACASPEVLIGAIAAATSRIRVGSGGVMLPHYSPLKVAETFSMLSGLYPRPHRPRRSAARRARDPLTTFALQRDRRQAAPDDFPAAARRTARVPVGPHAARSPLRAAGRAARPPGAARSPGCSARRRRAAIWAAEPGLPYAFAGLHQPAGAAIAAAIGSTSRPSRVRRRRT